MNISFHFNLQFESLSIHTFFSTLCLRTHVPFESSDYFHRLSRKANTDKLIVSYQNQRVFIKPLGIPLEGELYYTKQKVITINRLIMGLFSFVQQIETLLRSKIYTNE